MIGSFSGYNLELLPAKIMFFRQFQYNICLFLTITTDYIKRPVNEIRTEKPIKYPNLAEKFCFDYLKYIKL